MASNSHIISITKILFNVLQDVIKDTSATCDQQDAKESSSSENKRLEPEERLSQPTLEVALLGFSSIVKENMKDMKDFLSNTISRLEERVITLEEVVGRRLAAIESECCSSQEVEVVSDRLPFLEDNMSTAEDTETVVDRLSTLEDNMCTTEETKAIEDKLPSHKENVRISEETKAIAVRVSCLEKNMCTPEEKKAILDRMSTLENSMSTFGLMVEKYEEKLTSLAEMKGIEKHSTGKEEEFISKEAAMPQHFDTTYKGKNVLLTNASLTAERRARTNDEMYGGVISKFPLKEEEVFNIIIEETIDKYRGYGEGDGIAFGVITDKKAEVEGVRSISYNIKGTWAIRSNINSPKGKSNVYKDNATINANTYPLDTSNLPVGTVLGVKLCRNGDVHLFLNGLDKGVAFQNVPNNVFPFIDIIKYVTKIRIV